MNTVNYNINYDSYDKQFIVYSEEKSQYLYEIESNDELKKIESIESDWLKDFKSELFENWEYSCNTISEYIKRLIDEDIPIWIKESIEDIDLYLNYASRLKLINLDELEKVFPYENE